ncbi:MAG: 50S ribosomal protein L25/general stress protein Ctc [Alphaproteobacteria bacterium]|nr:MAG: 50S ribosomal protein L25/general stress protein Ctc [Alphaproteobacteria bacterium]
MSETLSLNAEARERVGKGSARAARRAGRVPAVIYGDKKPPVAITIARNELMRVINRGHFMNSTIDITVGKKTERVLPRDIQLHPVTDWPLHVDFLRLAKDARINIMVPVSFVNESASPGLKRGGVLNVVRHEIEFMCPASAIPDSIEVDLTGLDINDSIHISAVTLPEGVTPVIDDRDFTIATVVAPSALKSDEEAAGEADAEAAAEAEEAPEAEEAGEDEE